MRDTDTVIKLSDYKVPAYVVDTINLDFVLGEEKTVVTATSSFRKNPLSEDRSRTLFLNGDNLSPTALLLNDEEVMANMFEIRTDGLVLYEVPESFTLLIKTELNPEANTALTGLYLSAGNFCTQCEAEGFRRITYFPDRPDILARYTTRIEADRSKYPVLLSNGNLKEKGDLAGNRHYVIWEDPFPKPSYLFALVAGMLVCISDTYKTRSNKIISLEIYVQERNKNRCGHAMKSLKTAMKWDEDVFGLEYDLDRYMIVAVDDFNMGAMENKGLNIFNSKYVLASPETATDQDYMGIEGVIAHEYFHNWTGNRVTCRDWFQLSLKEGLTVFRDQEFSADINSRAVQRVDDVRVLRQFQFREDAGPMAHPVRPESYLEINNFYTVTIYNKGAELIRMIHTLVGPQLFRKGMDLYFQRHDGQAVTCDDFVAAMSDASGVDLGQFKLWYSQAGTPNVSVTERWDEESGEYTLQMHQRTDPTPTQRNKQPFHIPVVTGLLGVSQASISCDYKREGENYLLELRQDTQEFSFKGLSKKPIPSLFRNFSAPVVLGTFYSRDELLYLMSNDTDLFNRWDAAYSLATSIILEGVSSLKAGSKPHVSQAYIDGVKQNLVAPDLDPALNALALTLPAESYSAQLMDIVEPELLHESTQFLRRALARHLSTAFVDVYHRNNNSDKYRLTPEEMGKRRLKNSCLSFLVSIAGENSEWLELCLNHYYEATNMTDAMAALSSIVHHDIPERTVLLEDFEQKWIDEPLVMDKWFSLQALSDAEDTYNRILDLVNHPSFSMKNPNKVRSLIGAYSANHFHFHDKTGIGYRFLAQKIAALDPLNPQIAARLVTPFTTWKRYDESRQTLISTELERILSSSSLSRDVFEIVSKTLKS